MTSAGQMLSHLKEENYMIEKIQTLGLKDMHRMQVQALMEFVGTAIELALSLIHI